jgi:DNA-binding IclR family transcriptional regulator
MVAYLDDWLLFAPHIPVPRILQTLQKLGITINPSKSHLVPTRRLIYLGLEINLFRQQIQATAPCLQHLRELLALVPQVTTQDLRRITGY